MTRQFAYLASTCLLVAGSWLASSCTPLSDFAVHQCDTHSDCDTLDGVALRCEDSHCVEGCADNAHCASVDPRLPICTEHGGTCVGLISSKGECYVSTGYDASSMAASTGRDLLVVGAFAPTLRSSTWLTLQLAVDEINAQGGVPGAAGPRSLVAVLCDDSTAHVDAAMEHLVHGLHASAIVASLEDEPLRVALERASTEGLALFLSPNSADSWAAAPEGATQRAWYLGADQQSVVEAYPPLLRRAAAALEARGADPELLRIASVVSEAREDQDLARAVAGVIELGGYDAGDLARRGRFRSFELRSGSAEELQEVANYAPQLILVFVGGASLESPYLPRSSRLELLEASAAEPGSLQPTYIVGPRNVDDAFLASWATADASLRERVVGLRSDRLLDDDIVASLRARFDSVFPRAREPGLPLDVSLGAYDAVYYLAYAAAAAGTLAAENANSLVAGLASITDPNGERIDVGSGPQALDRARELLASHTPFNLYGTSGPAAFDPLQQSRSGVPRMYCFEPSGELAELGSLDSAGDPSPGSAACARDILDVGQE